MRILVVEDDPALSELLRRALSKEGHTVDVSADGTDALWMAGEVAYDAIVLDLMIPGTDGFSVCKALRAREQWTPVLMLTARDGVDDRVRGLDAGADDYLTKPFAMAELFARIRSITRREVAPRPTVLTAAGITIDPASHEVIRNGVRIELSPTEFALLTLFVRNAGRVLRRSEIIEQVWDFAYDGTSNVVDVYVRYLREKVDRPFGTHAIETVRGVGYLLRDDGEHGDDEGFAPGREG
jgi:two-component system, OmpR family, response regulator